MSSSSGQSITLNFGNVSSHIASQHWNLQYNLLNCAEENDFLDIDQIFIEKEHNGTENSCSHYSPLTLFFNTKYVRMTA